MSRKLLAGLVALAMTLAGCAGKPASNSPDASAPAAQKAADGQGATSAPIKVGAWIPLSGPIAVYGLPQRAGMSAYFKMVNEAGGVKGRKIEWIVEDNAYDPQRTVAIARKLVDQDQVLAIVGANGTGTTAAAFPYVLDQAKVPIINTFGSARDWFDPVRPYLFGSMVVYEDQARALGRWAAKDGAKKITVVYADVAAFENVAKNVQPGSDTVSPKPAVTLMPVKSGTTDWVPVALQLGAAKPDAIVLILAASDLVPLAKELSRQNIKIPMYTYAPNANADIIRLGGAAVEGLKAMAWTVPPTADAPAVEEYRKALAKYETGDLAKPDFQSLFTWVMAKIFVEAVKRIEGPVTRENLVKSLHSMKNYETGILPPVTFSEKMHIGVQGLQPVVLQNGDWKLVGGFIDPHANW